MAKRGFLTYKSYIFKDKDPAIDIVRTLVQDSGMSAKRLQDESGVPASTVRNWFKGPTRRPQFATLQAVARSTGHTFKCTKLVSGKRR